MACLLGEDMKRPLGIDVGLAPLLTINDLIHLLQLHKRTVQRLCRIGVLPQPIKLGGSNRWLASEVNEAIGKIRNEPRKNSDVVVTSAQ